MKKETAKKHAPRSSMATRTVRHSVSPGATARLSMKTLLNAICTLRHEDDVKSLHALKLIADEDGLIHLHLHASDEYDKIVRFFVDCEQEGKATTFHLDLRASHKPTAKMPAPTYGNSSISKQGARIRPALSKQEAVQMSDGDLLQRRYPPRPSADKIPTPSKNGSKS